MISRPVDICCLLLLLISLCCTMVVGTMAGATQASSLPTQAVAPEAPASTGVGSCGCEDRRAVKVYRKGDFVHFEQLLDDKEAKVKVTMSIWVSRDARMAGYFMISLRPSAPGNAGGHLYARGLSPITPNALRGLIPQCTARDYAEEFIRKENKKNRYYRDEADTYNNKGFPDNTVYPVKITKKGTFMHFSEDFIDAFNSNKSLSLTVTEDRRYLSFISLTVHGDTQGISSGSFWGEGSVSPASFHGVIPKSLARLELEKYLTAPTYTAEGEDATATTSDPHNNSPLLDTSFGGPDTRTANPFGWNQPQKMPLTMGPSMSGQSSSPWPQSFQRPLSNMPSSQSSRLGGGMPMMPGML